MNIFKRNDTYHLRRAVPVRFASVEPRKVIWISLATDSETVAQTKAPSVWENHLEAWEAKLAGDTTDAERLFSAARHLAKVRGFRYLPTEQVAKLPANELADRIEAARTQDGALDPVEARALLGAIDKPQITLTRALEQYWGLAADKTLGKSTDQIRRWENPRKKAVANFIATIGNKPINEISRDDMLEFRDTLLDKMRHGGLTASSANKDLIHLGAVLKTVNTMKKLGLDLPLGDLSFKEGKTKQRPSFSEKWIKTKLLAKGALDGLNTEARCILLGMVNTGYRPSEAAGLLPEHIRLDGDVPYISIEPTASRVLKTDNAERMIPLTGVSLEAFRQCPSGFPHYRDNPSLSATVNKFLRENGLLESEGHSFYGLRHSFEDRMLAAGVDERIRRDLLGHRLNRERYGEGGGLGLVHGLLESVAL